MAAMNSLLSVLIALHFLSLTSYGFLLQVNLSGRGLSYEEKARLGSTPPSCHNKCNLCHPCMAVQVPTMPVHSGDKPGQNRLRPVNYYDLPPSSSTGNRYSNYKPLGWKCRCGGHLYNP